MQNGCQSINIRTVKILKRILKWFTYHPSGTDILITLAFAALSLLNVFVNWGTTPNYLQLTAIVLTLLVVMPLISGDVTLWVC